MVSREDVASLAVASALFRTENVTAANTSDKTIDERPFHMTLAVRWCGKLDPPHAGTQGKKEDGCIDAYAGLQKVLFGNNNLRRKRKRNTVNPSMLRRFTQTLTRRRLKPYAIFVALPVYIMLGLLVTSLLPYAPGAERWLPILRYQVLPQLLLILKHALSTITSGFLDVRRLVSLRGAPKYISI